MTQMDYTKLIISTQATAIYAEVYKKDVLVLQLLKTQAGHQIKYDAKKYVNRVILPLLKCILPIDSEISDGRLVATNTEYVISQALQVLIIQDHFQFNRMIDDSRIRI